MKEIYEKALSIVINRLCLIVAVLAMLPIMIGYLFFNYILFKFLENEGLTLEPLVWNVMGIGFMCLALVLMFLFTSVMEGVDKELKKLYREMKENYRIKRVKPNRKEG
jgi:hypothetical protein